MRIAVVGGGVAGILAAHLLNKKHAVSLFEKNSYIGGHTRTHVVPDGPDAGTPVDTGFIVLNDRTYPILNQFLAALGVNIEQSDMSFSYFCERTGFQYASRNIKTLFADRRNLISPRYWTMLAEILVFNTMVLRQLRNGLLDDLTLGQYLQRFRFSKRFSEQYLYPMVAAIWSAPEIDVDRFPMLTFARFFNNHGLLHVYGQPQWYFVAGGSHTYVQAFLKQFGGDVYTNADIAAIGREGGRVILTDAVGHSQTYDKVVIATHADEAYRLLADPSEDERRLLGAWRYSTNTTFLHTDLNWLPTNRKAWASWNVIRASQAGADAPVTLTYHMNRLQRLRAQNDYLVTLNPFRPIAEERIVAKMTYTHPVFSFESLATQPYLASLNGVRNTAYCGSYFGYGFHEDAARAGVQAASALGVDHEF